MNKLRLAILILLLLALVGSETAWASAPSASAKSTTVNAWARCNNGGCNAPRRVVAYNKQPPMPKNGRACYTGRCGYAQVRNARRYGPTVGPIMRVNGIRKPNRVQVAQQRWFPKKKCCPPPPQPPCCCPTPTPPPDGDP